MTSTRKLFALIGMTMIAFVAFLEYTVVNTALPTIQNEFSISMLDLQWVFNIYSIVVAISMILAGRIGDLFGRRKIFYLGALLLGLGSLGAGFAPTYSWLIFFRAVQGLGVAATVTLASSLINLIYGDKAHYPMSFFAAFTGIGLAIGPYLGGVLVTNFGWEWIFFINIPLLVVAYLFCLPCLSESKASGHVPLDLKGALILSVTIVSLIVGLIKGEEIGWTQPLPLCCMLIFLIALPLLVKVENACKNPIINFSFFARKDFFLAGLVCVLGGGLISPALLFAPMFLQKIMSFSPEKAGLYLLMVPISVVVFAPLVGKVVGKTGTRKMLVVATFIATVSAVFNLVFVETSVLHFALIGFFLVGLSWVVINVASAMSAISAVEEAHAGTAVGIVYSLWNISSAIVIAVLSIVYNAVTRSHVVLGEKTAMLAGYKSVYTFVLILMVALFIIAVLRVAKKDVVAS